MRSIDAESRGSTGGSRLTGPVPAAAAALIAQARTAWAEAALESSITEKYRAAHIAALRGAAALLAARARPSTVPKHRPTSAWVLLEQVAPELAEWSVYFTDSARRRAAIEAGARSVVTERDADDLVRAAGDFISIIDRMIASLTLSTAS